MCKASVEIKNGDRTSLTIVRWPDQGTATMAGINTVLAIAHGVFMLSKF